MHGNSSHDYHQEIWSEIEKLAAQEKAPWNEHGDRYLGTTKPCYLIRTPTVHQMARDWIQCHPELTAAEYRALLDSLAQGRSLNEIIFIGELLRFQPDLRRTLEPRCLEPWLDRAEGWGEVDSMCQSSFPAQELLSNWRQWKSLLVSLAKSPNVHKRRASLVLLTLPVRESADARLAELAFANIERLKRENHVLITKAVSWLLRGLCKNHPQEVEAYVRENADSLPKIALRETTNKLRSGRKSGR